MESWRATWRDGFAPLFTREELEALAVALETDDPRLCQGATTYPLPEMANADDPVERACALGFVGTIREGGFACKAEQTPGGPIDFAALAGKPPARCPLTTYTPARVGAVDEHFAKFCFDADNRMGEPAACRHFLNAFDDWTRGEMRAELLPEIKLELARRAALLT